MSGAFYNGLYFVFPRNFSQFSQCFLSDLSHDWDKHVPELMEWQKELLSKG